MKKRNKLIVLQGLFCVVNIFTADVSRDCIKTFRGKCFVAFDEAPIWYALGAPMSFCGYSQRVRTSKHELTAMKIGKRQHVSIERCGDIRYFCTSAQNVSQEYRCGEMPGQAYKILTPCIDRIAVFRVRAHTFPIQDYAAEAKVYIGYNSACSGLFFINTESCDIFPARILKIETICSDIFPNKRPKHRGPQVQIPLRKEISELSGVDVIKELLNQVPSLKFVFPCGVFADCAVEEAFTQIKSTLGKQKFKEELKVLLGDRYDNFHVKTGLLCSPIVLLPDEDQELSP
jgi:hypothetical protein